MGGRVLGWMLALAACAGAPGAEGGSGREASEYLPPDPVAVVRVHDVPRKAAG